jgi:NADPH-dependent 2,4-dienoyl-CoA reductase/sulfur reductase-like enzyme
VSSAEEESYHQGTASMSTDAALEGDDAFTTAPSQNSRTVTEPARETPVHAETQVLVVGGGPAGCAAAVAARRVGAEVVLV